MCVLKNKTKQNRELGTGCIGTVYTNLEFFYTTKANLKQKVYF